MREFLLFKQHAGNLTIKFASASITLNQIYLDGRHWMNSSACELAGAKQRFVENLVTPEDFVLLASEIYAAALGTLDPLSGLEPPRLTALNVNWWSTWASQDAPGKEAQHYLGVEISVLLSCDPREVYPGYSGELAPERLLGPFILGGASLASVEPDGCFQLSAQLDAPVNVFPKFFKLFQSFDALRQEELAHERHADVELLKRTTHDDELLALRKEIEAIQGELAKASSLLSKATLRYQSRKEAIQDDFAAENPFSKAQELAYLRSQLGL